MTYATPAETAKALDQALSSHFSGHYLKVESGRGVAVVAGRMDPEHFAKEQFTKGYTAMGVNPVARVLIVPDSGNDWTSLTVRSGAGVGEGDDVLKEVGVQPIRRASKLPPEKAVKLVTEWFVKNSAKLKSGADVKTAHDWRNPVIYNYDRRRLAT